MSENAKELIQTAIIALAFVAGLGIIIYGVNLAAQRSQEIRRICIEQHGYWDEARNSCLFLADKVGGR